MRDTVHAFRINCALWSPQSACTSGYRRPSVNSTANLNRSLLVMWLFLSRFSKYYWTEWLTWWYLLISCHLSTILQLLHNVIGKKYFRAPVHHVTSLHSLPTRACWIHWMHFLHLNIFNSTVVDQFFVTVMNWTLNDYHPVTIQIIQYNWRLYTVHSDAKNRVEKHSESEKKNKKNNQLDMKEFFLYCSCFPLDVLFALPLLLFKIDV